MRKYGLTPKGAELMALMEAFAMLAAKATKESGGAIGLPDVSFTAGELTAESAFTPGDGLAFVETLWLQGYLTEG